MITASDYLFIKACHPQQERVPKWKTRGPNDRSETPSRQSLYFIQTLNYRQAFPNYFSVFLRRDGTAGELQGPSGYAEAASC